MKQAIITIIIVLAVVIGAIWMLKPSTQVSFGNAVGSQTLPAAATTTASFAVTTSVRILATSTSSGGGQRVYAAICNPNATPVYISMNRDAKMNLVTGAGIPIAAAAGYNVCFEITGGHLYQGAIQASSTNQTSTKIYVTDYRY